MLLPPGQAYFMPPNQRIYHVVIPHLVTHQSIQSHKAFVNVELIGFSVLNLNSQGWRFQNA